MEKRYVIILAVVIVLSIILSAFLFRKIYPTTEKEVCETISENQGKNKVDVVFLTNNVQKNKIESYTNFLINSEPFSPNKEKFNFYYAGNVDCEIQNNILFCYSRNLIRKSSVCKNDYVVVLSSQQGKIRSSAYMNVLSLNINHPFSVLLHEFGHVFANLADEYVPSIIPRGAKNCQKECEKFIFSEIDECFQGCSKDSYYRSSDASVMKTLSTNDYKKLNIEIIKKNLEKYE